MPTTPRTSLVASGFLAGALLGMLPPVQTLYASWQCAYFGGHYDDAVRTCAYRSRGAVPAAVREPAIPLELLDRNGR
jgi:hypothetical protein